MGNLTNCSKNNEFDTSEFTYANYNILFVGVSGVGKSSLID